MLERAMRQEGTIRLEGTGDHVAGENYGAVGDQETIEFGRGP